MTASDKDWLLVKKHWQPIEELLAEACPETNVAQEQIDQLQGRIDASVVEKLHKLRIARNDVIHGNRPLPDQGAFEEMASSVTTALHALQGRHLNLPKSFEARITFNLAFWAMTFGLVNIAIQAAPPSDQAHIGWKVAIALYIPLVWIVKTAITSMPLTLITVPLAVIAMSIVTSLVPRTLERLLRVYVLAPATIAFIGNHFQ